MTTPWAPAEFFLREYMYKLQKGPHIRRKGLPTRRKGRKGEEDPDKDKNGPSGGEKEMKNMFNFPWKSELGAFTLAPSLLQAHMDGTHQKNT